MSGRRRILVLGALLVPGLATACSTGNGDPGPAASRPGPAAASSPAAPRSDAATEAPSEPGSASGSPTGAGRGRPAAGMPTLGPHRVQSDVLRRLPGRAGEACVAVGNHRDVRSGGLAAGPFDTARKGYSPEYGDAQVIRLYLVPEHAASMPGVVVTARRQGGAETVRTRETAGSDAEDFRFYDVDLALPRAGRWTIRAVAGADRGCWTVDLR